MAKRHDSVLEAIDRTVSNAKATKPFRILEIGVYDGNNAIRMIKHAMSRGRMNVSYYGVDLFEDLTSTKSKEEMSKSKLPPTRKQVADKIRQVTKACWVEKGMSYHIIRENSLRNIPQVDVIFVDGGHSLETIYQDWMAVLPLIHDKTQIVFDDYYRNKDDFGCSRLVDFLATDPAYKVEILDQVDRYPTSGLDISCAIVTRVSMYPLNIPNSVRGLAEWSDPPADETVPTGEDHGKPETVAPGTQREQSEEEHLPASPGSVPAGGDTKGTDPTEQHSSADGVHGPERGDESGAVGAREEGGNQPNDPASGDISDTERKEGDSGSHDQTSDTAVSPVSGEANAAGGAGDNQSQQKP